MSADDRDEAFLARWSRRKRAAKDGEGTTAPAVAGAEAGRQPNDGDGPDPPIDLTTLPKIDDLLPDSDIRAFLQKGVPEELRRLALRKAWALDPRIRDFVEMAENQYDWNVPGGAPGFGDLDPKANLESLLAQATGALREAADTVAGADGPRTAAPLEVRAQADAPRPASTDPADPAAAARPLEPAAAAVPAPLPEDAAIRDGEHETDKPARRARRHGGALPRA